LAWTTCRYNACLAKGRGCQARDVRALHSSLAPAGAFAQSARELNDAAWKLLDSGDVARASKLFAAGLAKEPDQPALLLGAGVAAHLLGRSKEAVVPLRRALDLDPHLTPASILLGQIAYSDGNVADAITIYEKALTHAPNHPHLTAKLKAWRADADASTGFTERRFDRFRVMFRVMPTTCWRLARQRFSKRRSGGSARPLVLIRPSQWW
jgi:tetratricopeptide (TPR) repeat protein